MGRTNQAGLSLLPVLAIGFSRWARVFMTAEMKTDAIPNLWQHVFQLAQTTEIDPEKFGAQHQAVVADIVEFLTQPTLAPSPPRWTNWFTKPALPPLKPCPPIILCGAPGTGKTTFLYLLDLVLRDTIGLPDTITPLMQKPRHRDYVVQKRLFAGRTLSLLSVRKWAELLHFYEWDTTRHRLEETALAQFIERDLAPMQIIFADEVERTGYAPTIPTLAKHGILVVGTSNQSHFRQLISAQITPRMYEFGGSDLRAGNPADAIVQAHDPAWQLFVAATETPDPITDPTTHLPYQAFQQTDTVYVYLDFKKAVRAPLLETEWINVLNRIYQATIDKPRTNHAPYTILLDQFSLETLRTDYNAIIRFVSLFDAIEQMAVGVFVRDIDNETTLSRAALQHMKVTIESTRGVSPEIKDATVAGIDRCASRLGQAGHLAQTIFSPRHNDC